MKGLRNPAIEAYRCLLMFGICILHSCHIFYPNSAYWPKSVLCTCVVGFVFISGWFGVRFSVSKVMKLCGVYAYCLGIVFCWGRLWEGASISCG